MFRIRKPANENPLVRPIPSKDQEVVAGPSPDLHQRIQQLTERTAALSVSVATTAWPNYLACAEKLKACAGWLCGLSMFRALGNKAAQVHLRRRLQKASGEHGWQQKLMTHEWDQATRQWYGLPVAREPDEYLEWAVPVADLRQFVEWALERSRKTREEKVRLFALFDLTLNEQQVETLKGPVENELLAVLSQCLPFKVEYQYRVGKYRLDAFIPRLRLAIQIDEQGHRGYDAGDEKEYDEVLRDNNIVCLRFNPDQKYGGVPPQYELVRQVWERTLSPDFGAFREKHKLV